MDKQYCSSCKQYKFTSCFINPKNNNDLKYCLDCTMSNWCRHDKNKYFCKHCNGNFQKRQLYHSLLI